MWTPASLAQTNGSPSPTYRRGASDLRCRFLENLQDIATEVLVLHQRAKALADEVGVDRDGLTR